MVNLNLVLSGKYARLNCRPSDIGFINYSPLCIFATPQLPSPTLLPTSTITINKRLKGFEKLQ